MAIIIARDQCALNMDPHLAAQRRRPRPIRARCSDRIARSGQRRPPPCQAPPKRDSWYYCGAMRIAGSKLVLSTIVVALVAAAVAARADDLLDKLGAPANANVAAVKAGDVEATITPSATHAAPGQEIAVHALLDIAPGWHIYGKPLPQGYTPTSIVFDNN